MISTDASVPFSDLAEHPEETLDRLNAVRVLRLRREDGDIALLSLDRMEQHDAVVDVMVRLLAGSVRACNDAVLRQVLRDAIPWLTFLPDQEVEQFLHDLVDVAEDTASSGDPAPVASLLTRWRHSAEAYADPAWTTAPSSGADPGGGPDRGVSGS